MELIDLPIPEKFRVNQAWSDLTKSINTLFSDNIYNLTKGIANVRDPKLIEKEFLSILASTLGFNLQSDLFDEESYRKLIAALSNYYEVSGTNKIQDFIGYVQNGKYEIKAQWTQDYIKFHDYPKGTTIYDGGSWYITPHVVLKYDAEMYATQPDLSIIESLFYELAPIHLVLKAIVATYYAYMKLYFSAHVVVRIVYPRVVAPTSVNVQAAAVITIIQK
jgi:hypothetical protein